MFPENQPNNDYEGGRTLLYGLSGTVIHKNSNKKVAFCDKDKDARIFITCNGTVIGTGVMSQPLSSSDKMRGDTVSDESNLSRKWKKSDFTITGNGTISETELANQLLSDGDKVRGKIIPDERHLPRKWKKASRSKFRRDTKWKRKFLRWMERYTIEFTGRISYDEGLVTITGQKS